ncbi:YncE family protein [Novosphingobium rosa]|uniref:YncE family protein n=1 Tax=Novosphingobium rosa TaxID=76978 RepID=UPI0008379F06|nr:YncE family protein [Novosphingobium rosa]
MTIFSRSMLLAGMALACGLASTAVRADDAGHWPYRLAQTTPIPGGALWQGLAFEPASDRLFFAYGDHVDVMNATSGKLVGRIAGIGDAHGLVIRTATGRGYVSNGARGTVSEFDLATLKVLREIPADGGTDTLAFDAVSGHLFSMNGGSHDVSVLDLAGKDNIATIRLGGQPEMGGTDDSGHLFVNLKSTGEIVKIDTATNRITQRTAIPACERPHGVAYHPGVKRLFLSCGGGQMLVLDPADLHTVAQLPIAPGTDTVQIDAARNLVFSPNGTGSLSVVHVESADRFTVTEMPTAIGARTMTFSPRSGRLFLPTGDVTEASANPANPKSPDYAFHPNTLRMMIYDPAQAR